MGSRETREIQIDDTIMLLPESQNDGNAALRFSQDNLSVSADFFPPAQGGAPLNPGQVIEALNRHNVVYGLIRENIENAVRDCNLNREAVKGVTVARGDPPVREVLEYFELNPNLKTPAPEEPDGNARMDYRVFSPFVIVKKGQALAHLCPRREGRDGKDIHGNLIAHGSLKPDGVSGGENTRAAGKYMYAAINGQFIEQKGVLSVRESLVIKGGVDYHTGNIAFPGDITIEGPVSDGFKIYSGGSVTLKQTFDVTEAVTQNDLAVSGGIIGRGRALVKVGGELKTKFIENCKVACRKTISVDADIVNSSVYTMDRVEMGDKGKILGGEIYAVHGVKTCDIGKKSGRATSIHCGIDFTALQDRDRMNYRLRIINAKLKRLREIIAAGKGSGAEETLARLEEEQKKMSADLASTLGRLNVNDSAVVEASGTIAPGALIEICQIALFVTEPLQRVRLRLDRTANKIVSEPLG